MTTTDDEAVVVIGVIHGYRTTADNCLMIQIELNEPQAAQFHKLGFLKRQVVSVFMMDLDSPKG